MDRTRALLFAIVCLAVTWAGACSPAGQSKTQLSTADILAQASQKIKEVKSLHFKLESLNGSTPIALGLGMDAAEGDVAKPDKMKVQVKASILKQALEVSFISVGQDAYMTNPLNGKWETLAGGMNPMSFFDPNAGAVNVLDGMKSTEKLADETVDGVATYHVRGLVPTSALKSIAGEDVEPGDVKTEVWVGVGDFFPRRFRLDGKILKADKDDIARVLQFSRFDQPVTIEPPK